MSPFIDTTSTDHFDVIVSRIVPTKNEGGRRFWGLNCIKIVHKTL